MRDGSQDYIDIVSQQVTGLAGAVMLGVAQAWLVKRPEFVGAEQVSDV